MTDQSAAIISGASVKAVHVATNFERQVTTSNEGSYTIPQLPVGGYVVIVTARNFQTTTLENIEVTAGGTVRVDAKLAVGGLQDAVTVTADARQIQADSVKVTTAISSKFIQDLPLVVGGQLRSPLDLSLIAPEAKAGTSGDGGRGNIVIGGGQEGGWDLTVDGVSATPGAPFEQRLWTTLNSPSVEAITEFAVDTNGFKAEFGHAGGGAVSFVSRSGSNRWQGKVFEFFRHDSLDTINYFSKALGRPKPPLEQHDFGGVFGGPVVLPWIVQRTQPDVLLRVLRGIPEQDRRGADDRHHPDGGHVRRRLLRVARRQRQSHSHLRPGDHARESERARVHPRSVSGKHDPARPVQPESPARSSSWRPCGPTCRVCATISSTRRATPSTRTRGTSSASSSITTSRARIGWDFSSTGARCSSFRRAAGLPEGCRSRLNNFRDEDSHTYVYRANWDRVIKPDAPQSRDVRAQQLVADPRLVQSRPGLGHEDRPQERAGAGSAVPAD